jgi:CRP-like cAMP-binding protein
MDAKVKTCKFCEEKSCAVARLNNTELDLLSENIQHMEFDKGETLFREGALNAHIFYLKQGLVKLHMKVTDERDFILKISLPPCYLGLATIFGDRVNRYSATALEPSRVCIIDINTFNSLIHSNGDFAAEIIADICRDELSNFERYVRLSHKQTPGRLAGSLLFFSDRVYKNLRFELPIDRSELAEMLGLSREIVSRTLTQFHQDGLVDIDKKHVAILDRDMLQEIFEAG